MNRLLAIWRFFVPAKPRKRARHTDKLEAQAWHENLMRACDKNSQTSQSIACDSKTTRKLIRYDTAEVVR